MISPRLNARLAKAKNEPLVAGYVTHSGHVIEEWEAAGYNQYTAEAAKYGNSAAAVEFYLNQRHKWFALCDATA